MKLSKKTDYAFRALFALIARQGGQPAALKDLARENEIPQRFLDHILRELKDSGWVRGVKGKGGGYVLARSPKEITMGQVIRRFDGVLAPLPCVSASHYESCGQELKCQFRRVLLELRNAAARTLDEADLASVLALSPVQSHEVFDQTLIGGAGI